jgi:hypothetical protein
VSFNLIWLLESTSNEFEFNSNVISSPEKVSPEFVSKLTSKVTTPAVPPPVKPIPPITSVI